MVKVEEVSSEYILKRESRGFPDRVVIGSKRKGDVEDVSDLSHWTIELPSAELGKSQWKAGLW